MESKNSGKSKSVTSKTQNSKTGSTGKTAADSKTTNAGAAGKSAAAPKGKSDSKTANTGKSAAEQKSSGNRSTNAADSHKSDNAKAGKKPR